MAARRKIKKKTRKTKPTRALREAVARRPNRLKNLHALMPPPIYPTSGELDVVVRELYAAWVESGMVTAIDGVGQIARSLADIIASAPDPQREPIMRAVLDGIPDRVKHKAAELAALTVAGTVLQPPTSGSTH